MASMNWWPNASTRLPWDTKTSMTTMRCAMMALLWVLVGKADVTGDKRVRERDRGHALASASTLNRLELGEPGEAARGRYKRIVARPEELDELLVELLVESHRRAPREIWLDLDATDDPVHGHQEGRFFHGYYGCYCYLPLYIFCGEHLLCARLRPSDRDASAGSVEELERIVGQLRRHWPNTRIGIRGDSGFCRESILRWCEDNGIDHVLGLARNKRLVRAIGAQMRQAQAAHRRTGKAARRYRDFTCRTRKSWSRSRRVVGKAEYLTKGREPALRGDQSFHSPGRCQAPVREAVLRPRRHGEPHKRAAAWPVRRPHQRANDAREPVAPVLLLLRLCADAVTSSTRRPRHRAGPRSSLHPAG